MFRVKEGADRGRYQLHLQRANSTHWTGADSSYSDTLLGLLSTYALSGRRLSTEALLKPEMYIEEITIEGFKSYAQRVIVPNFDPYFNAITGLNGSGKSNILDSICFVLGITNLSQVTPSGLPAARLSVNNPFPTRMLVYAFPPKAQTVHASCFQLVFPSRSVIAWAHQAYWNDHTFHKKTCYYFIVISVVQVRANSLQELVYKQGQAGITKASVSIVFNNQDKQNSPVGYEHFDQLTVTRQVGHIWPCRLTLPQFRSKAISCICLCFHRKCLLLLRSKFCDNLNFASCSLWSEDGISISSMAMLLSQGTILFASENLLQQIKSILQGFLNRLSS